MRICSRGVAASCPPSQGNETLVLQINISEHAQTHIQDVDVPLEFLASKMYWHLRRSAEVKTISDEDKGRSELPVCLLEQANDRSRNTRRQTLLGLSCKEPPRTNWSHQSIANSADLLP